MPKQVLVVDDEVVLRNLYAEILADAGYAVSQAASGEEALEKIGVTPFCGVVTDLNMPGMSGIDLTTKIKRDKPDIQVILLTSHADFDLAKKKIDLGFYWYLIKPLDDLNYLVEKMAEAIRPP